MSEAKICLITGANSGIGRAAAIQIAAKGYRIVMGCRNKQRGEAAQEQIIKASGSDAVELLLVDMSLRSSIEEAALAFEERHDRLDVLIHNSATFDYGQKERLLTAEGIELVWATNHLGPVRLTERLIPLLQQAEQGRIVLVSSKGLVVYPNLKVDLADPEFSNRKFTITKAYYQSKLAQVCYNQHLATELDNSSVTVNDVRVTNVKIDVTRYPKVSSFMRWVYSIKSRFSISPEEMAQTYTWLATDPSLAGRSGGVFEAVGKEVKPSKAAMDSEHVAAVMAVTRRYLDGEAS